MSYGKSKELNLPIRIASPVPSIDEVQTGCCHESTVYTVGYPSIAEAGPTCFHNITTSLQQTKWFTACLQVHIVSSLRVGRYQDICIISRHLGPAPRQLSPWHTKHLRFGHLRQRNKDLILLSRTRTEQNRKEPWRLTMTQLRTERARIEWMYIGAVDRTYDGSKKW